MKRFALLLLVSLWFASPAMAQECLAGEGKWLPCPIVTLEVGDCLPPLCVESVTTTDITPHPDDPCLDGFWENLQFWRKCPSQATARVLPAAPRLAPAVPQTPGTAQTTSPAFAIRLGATLQPSGDTPRPAGLFALVMGDGETRSITGFVLSRTDAQVVTAVQTGIERTLLKTSRFELAACGQVGIATNAEATSGIFSGCTVAIVPILRNLSLIVSGIAQNAPVRGGTWDPQASVSLQWKPE